MIFNMTLSLFEVKRAADNGVNTEQSDTDVPATPDGGTDGGSEAAPDTGTDTDDTSGSSSGSSNTSGGSDVKKSIILAEITDFNEISLSTSVSLGGEAVRVYADGAEVGTVKTVTSGCFGTVELSESVDLGKSYQLLIDGYGEKSAIPTDIFNTPRFINEYTYSGDDLGAVVNGAETTFKLWAPTASDVCLNVYPDAQTSEGKATVRMSKNAGGVWSYTYGCGSGTYYTYTVTTSLGTNEVTDPYAKASAKDGTRSITVDTTALTPTGWNASFSSGIASYSDAFICETDVAGFSTSMSQSGYKGKYLAFTELGLVNENGAPIGIDHLKSLGVTHVRLNSVFAEDCNSPTCQYSTDGNDPLIAIKEFRSMVLALHNAGIGVIVDADYSYTGGAVDNLDKIVPYYFRRTPSTENDESYPQRQMYRKLLCDSVSYWINEYGLDGFCLIYMDQHDLETVQGIESAVHSLKPDAVIFGKLSSASQHSGNVVLADRNDIRKIVASGSAIGGVSVINDALLDKIAGIPGTDTKGYVNGSAAHSVSAIVFGLRSGEASYEGLTVSTDRLVNCLGSNAAASLWERLADEDTDTAYRKAYFATSVLMLSKGAVMLPLGDEFFNTQDSVDWSLAGSSAGKTMSQYISSLLKLREEYPLLTDAVAECEATVYADGSFTLHLISSAGERLTVISNPQSAPVQHAADQNRYVILINNAVCDSPIQTAGGSVELGAYSIAVMVDGELLPE